MTRYECIFCFLCFHGKACCHEISRGTVVETTPVFVETVEELPALLYPLHQPEADVLDRPEPTVR